LADLSEFEEALRVVATIEDDRARVIALSGVAARLVLANDARGWDLFAAGLASVGPDGVPDDWPEIKEMRREAANLTRSDDPGAVGKWRDANARAGSLWRTWLWGVPQYHADGLLRIAADLFRARRPEAENTFNEACSVALTIPYENVRDETLLKAVREMIAVDQLELAEITLRAIHAEQDCLIGVRALVKAYNETEQIDSALRVARMIGSDYYRREVVREVAGAFARANRMVEVFEILEEATLDSFIQAISMVCAHWSAAPPGAVISSMRSLTRVAGWARTDWCEVDIVLQR
jgi:hypothetical protein